MRGKTTKIAHISAIFIKIYGFILNEKCVIIKIEL